MGFSPVPLVAVAPKKFVVGYEPGHEDAPAVCEVLPLREALERVYRTDAHLMMYVVEGATKQPRINKPGLDLWPTPIWTYCFFADVDNDGHAPWTDEGFNRAQEVIRKTPSLETAGVYFTLKGYRIVQPLATPLPVHRVEAHLRGWLAILQADGIAVDTRCKEWNRLFRLPNVPREPGGRSRCFDLSRMRPIELQPLAEPQPAQRNTPVPRRSGESMPPIQWTGTVPAVYHAAVDAIATAVRTVPTEWHTLFLALAGALLSRQVPPEVVPAFCRAVSIATSADDRIEDRERSARTTVERWRAGLPTTGMRVLEAEWPRIASVVHQTLSHGGVQRAHLEAAVPRPPAPPARESLEQLESVLRKAPDGVTVVVAVCGLGKTHAVLRIAAERAAKGYASDDAKGVRAPAQSKTVISVDKHTLGEQLVGDLASMSVDAGRFFGPLSKKDASGAPVCRYHDTGERLVFGGLSIPWELCRGRDATRCEHWNACDAKDGYEGPERARVFVGTHGSLPRLIGAAGSTGLAVLDEPPHPLETIELALEDFALVETLTHAFDSAYIAAVWPAFLAVKHWLAETDDCQVPTTLPNVVRAVEGWLPIHLLDDARRYSNTPAGDAVDCAKSARSDEQSAHAPPPRHELIQIAKRRLDLADRVGRAARVLGAVRHALASDVHVAARIEKRRGRRALVLTRPREHIVDALRREGATVVLDANGELWAETYSKIVGYPVRLHRFDADDGAPIARTMIVTSSATRKAWQPNGKLELAPSLLRALSLAIDWARDDADARSLAIITFPLLHLVLESLLSPSDESIAVRWTKAGQQEAMIATVRDALAPIIARWTASGRQLLLGHYGATRGLNHMADADALVTLGDPWANLADVRNDCTYLGLENWDERYESYCRAELEQAQGRLRTIHRTRPGRALHIGRVRPGGNAWLGDRVMLREFPKGPPRAEHAPRADFAALVDRLGGTRAAARALGVAASSISGYVHGTSAVPPKLLERAQQMVPAIDARAPR